jgi:hypothetical protein
VSEDRGVSIEDLDEIDGLISAPEKPKKTSSSRKGSRGGGSSSALSRRLEKMIGLLGNVIEPMDQFDGQILKDNSKEIAEALADLANESPRVKAFLEGSLEGGAWTAVGLLIGGKVVLPVAVHHSWLPATMNDQLAAGMDIPVRRKKARRVPVETPGHTIPEVGDDQEGEIVPFRNPQYGRVRDPETGDMVTVKLDPNTGRPKVDGDGRPIIDE